MHSQVWAGWRHLVQSEDNLELDSFQSRLLSEKESVEMRPLLECISEYSPDLLIVENHLLKVEDRTIISIMEALEEVVEPEHPFKILWCFLEVISAGNSVGRFRIPIPDIPVREPLQPSSPFQVENFANAVALQPLIDKLVFSIGDIEPIGAEEQKGRILLSAILFGGLLKTSYLHALPSALMVEQDPLFRWIELNIPAREGENAEFFHRRWFPDPFTRLLLIQQKNSGFSRLRNSRDSGLAKQVWAAIFSFAHLIGGGEQLPPNLSSLRSATKTRMHFYIEPYLVHYAEGRYESTSLPVEIWRRMIDPPQGLVLDLHDEREMFLEECDAAEAEDSDFVEVDMGVWPAQLRQLATILRSSASDVRRQIQCWRADELGRLLPSVRLLSEWVSEWLLTSKHNTHRPLAVSTAYQMLNAGGGRIVGLLGDEDPSQFQDSDSFVDLYMGALEDAPTRHTRVKTANALRSFHRFLEKNYQVPSLHGEKIFSTVRHGLNTVDANMICFQTFERANHWVFRNAKRIYGVEVARQLSLIASIGFFAGLRRSEVLGLKVSDVEGVEHGEVNLLVRPNPSRSLKTKNANRVIPVSLWMPKRVLSALLKWRKECIGDERGAKSYDQYLFQGFIKKGKLLSVDKRVLLITEALQHASSDRTVRFHHLRHSFSNWQLLRVWGGDLSEKELQKSFRYLMDGSGGQLDHDSLLSIKKTLFGDAETSRRPVMQLAQLMGHSGVDITFSSYVHLLDLVLGQSVRRLVPAVDVDTLCRFSGHAREYLSGVMRRLEGGEETVNAALVEWLIECPRYRSAKPVTELKSVVTMYGKLSGMVEAINAAAYLKKNPEHQFSNPEHLFFVEDAEIERWLSRLKWYEVGIARQAGVEVDEEKEKKSKYEIFDLPEPGKQLELAQKVVDWIERVSSEGLPPELKSAAVKKRVNKLLSIFVTGWVKGTPLTVRCIRLADAKLWVWFLRHVGLGKGVEGVHIPRIMDKKQNVNKQLLYWREKLGVQIEQKADGHGWLREGERGVIEIAVDLRKAGLSEYRSPINLIGIRLQLVMYACYYEI